MKVIGLAGWSGAGKTTLLTRLIPHFVAEGLRVSTIKHAHHNFDVDVPGKDSWVHRQSGATEVLISSSRRWALMHELRDATEPSLREHLKRMSSVDLVVVEGFKADTHPKIEVYRAANGKPFLFPDDRAITRSMIVRPPIVRIGLSPPPMRRASPPASKTPRVLGEPSVNFHLFSGA